jgi:hypothetical protein
MPSPVSALKWFPWCLSFAISTSALAKPTPIPLANCQQLLAIPTQTALSYQLVNDIDCEGYDVIAPKLFRGRLDGQGHRIANLTLRPVSGFSAGLFAKTHGAHISNLILEGWRLQATDTKLLFAGLVAGELVSSDLENILITDAQTLPNSNHYPHAEFGIALVAGKIQSSHLKRIALQNNELITNHTSNHIGGIAGQIQQHTHLERLQVSHTRIEVRIEGKPKLKHSLGGLVGTLYPNTSIKQAGLEAVELYDAGHSERTLGMGFMAGVMQTNSLISQFSLDQNQLQQANANPHRVGTLVGFSYQNSRIAFLCDGERIPNLKWKNGLGQLQLAHPKTLCSTSFLNFIDEP